MLRCVARPDSPHFLILDEMNLSHVERYFGRFLSIMEANRGLSESAKFCLLSPEEIALVSTTLEADEHYPLEAESAARLARENSGLAFPDNMLVVGTVNVDETTYMFSPKVLDRAHVIEMDVPDPLSYLRRSAEINVPSLPTETATMILRRGIARSRSGYWEREAPMPRIVEGCRAGSWEAHTEAIIDAVEKSMVALQRLLVPVGFGFAYRSINEVCSYLATYLECGDQTLFAAEGQAGWHAALDRAVFQKLLPRLHGNRRQLGDCLTALEQFLAGSTAQYVIGNTRVEVTDVEKLGFELRQSRRKIRQMLLRLDATGHTTFVC
jgi:hypothetical protein